MTAVAPPLPEAAGTDFTLRRRGIYAFGPFKLDPIRRTLLRDGAAVPLPSRLFETLLYLVEHPERPVARDELERAVWHGRVVEDGNLQRAVSSLRKALRGGDASPAYIVTISRHGFQFVMPVTLEANDAGAAAADAVSHSSTEIAAPRAWGRTALLMLGLVVLLVLGVWRWQQGGTSQAPFTPPPHSVAVLAFANMSANASDAYFSDGLADEVIATLGRIGGLRVAARTSAFSFKGRHLTANVIGRQLNVAAILEGSVRRDGENVHVAVHLIDTRTGFEFWSRSYDRNRFLDDLLKVQADIAESVSTSLQVKLLDSDAAGLTAGGTHNAGAFDSYLRGMNDSRELQEANQRQAIVDFTDAVALDPKYARAFAGRAAARYFLVFSGSEAGALQDQQDTAAAIEDADRAISLAPTLAEAHRVKSLILYGALEFRAAAEELGRALDLAPNDASVVATSGMIEAILGHYQLAIAASRHAIALDPYNPLSYRTAGETFFYMRRFDEALEAFGHATAVDKGASRLNLAWIASTYIAKGDAAAAARICAGGSAWSDNACLAMAYHALGRQAEADAALAALRRSFGDRGAYIYAEIYAQWGKAADALRWLEMAYRLKDSGITTIKVSPFLDTVRALPEFADVERRLNFPP
jgi:TolB-like protein/DNA-binding winged helix-turn-helix (wHTH) protein/Tfp pilus assembly protein PilF